MTSCGFDSLPNQITTRRLKHDISFNVLIVGSHGIGKTTLINSLFDFECGDSPDLDNEIKDVSLRIKEFRPNNKSFDIKITLIETKGFCGSNERAADYKPIVGYIDKRFEDYSDNELKVQQTRYNDISDTRVHCCIHILEPNAFGLRAPDIITMKQLHQRVCLIPVIGKSDILNLEERKIFKDNVLRDINAHGINIYSSEELPLAVAASNEVVTEDGVRKRVRVYPYAKMYIDKDSEFSKLKNLILRDMMSLKEMTDRVYYEKYREQADDELKEELKKGKELRSQ